MNAKEINDSAINLGLDLTQIADIIQKWGSEILVLVIEALRSGLTVNLVMEILKTFGPEVLKLLIDKQNKLRMTPIASNDIIEGVDISNINFNNDDLMSGGLLTEIMKKLVQRYDVQVIDQILPILLQQYGAQVLEYVLNNYGSNIVNQMLPKLIQQYGPEVASWLATELQNNKIILTSDQIQGFVTWLIAQIQSNNA